MTQLTTLDNGLRVASLSMPGLETAAVALSVDTGSRFEEAAVNGVAHLFEHMVFKGTATRSARAIAEEIEDVGGSLNAYTGRDITVFHARVLANDLPLGLDIIGDLVRNARFDEAELARERQVVLQELGEARDTPDDIIYDHLQATAFPDQPFGRSILGDEASIAAIDRDALIAWQRLHYAGSSMVVSAAGKVDHDALVAQAARLFGDLPQTIRTAPHPAIYTGGDLADKRRFEQAHLTLGWQGPAHDDADHYALMLYATAAGGGMSSRLFQELREERGLAYSIYASHAPYADTGLFSVYMATAKKDVAQAIDLTRDVLAASAANLDSAELARAKAQVKAGLMMALEGCAAQAESIGRQLLVFGRIVAPSEIVGRIDSVTVDDVRTAASRMLARPMTRASVGAALPA